MLQFILRSDTNFGYGVRIRCTRIFKRGIRIRSSYEFFYSDMAKMNIKLSNRYFYLTNISELIQKIDIKRTIVIFSQLSHPTVRRITFTSTFNLQLCNRSQRTQSGVHVKISATLKNNYVVGNFEQIINNFWCFYEKMKCRMLLRMHYLHLHKN